MATRKPAAASKSTAVVPWEQEMAARAAKAKKTEKIVEGFQKINVKGGVLTVDGEAIEGNELRCIILMATHENQYYTQDFDPSNPTVPACYAFSDPDSEADDLDGEMAPHQEAEDPQGSEDGKCVGCWANEFGSAAKGRGKACKNIRRLAVLTEDAAESASAMAEAEVRMLNVPVMSVKNYSKYAHRLSDDVMRPTFGVITLIKVVPDPKSQFQIQFSFEELINFDGELYEAVKKKIRDVSPSMTAPYPKQADLDAAQQSKPVRPQGRLAQSMARGKAPAKTASKAPAKTASKAPAKTAPAKRGKF